MVSVTASVAWWARTQPEHLALVYGHQRLTYADLQQRVVHAATMLQAHGVGVGDVVALLMKNSAAFLELSLAIAHVGAVLLPVNYRLGVEEVGYIAGHAGAKRFCGLASPCGGTRRIPLRGDGRVRPELRPMATVPPSPRR